jgi:uncharacterized protein (DUF2236 family)
MVTIYGARSTAEAMITRVRRMHDMVAGTTPSGEAYCANDPELLNWVHGTAAYGFLQAYHAYVRPLSQSERDRYYAEGIPTAGLYGATDAPTSEADLEMLFDATAGQLERSDIVFEFLAIMRSAPILPLLLRPTQHLLVRAAVQSLRLHGRPKSALPSLRYLPANQGDAPPARAASDIDGRRAAWI